MGRDLERVNDKGVGVLRREGVGSQAGVRSLPIVFVSIMNRRQIPTDASGDPYRGGLERVPRRMR